MAGDAVPGPDGRLRCPWAASDPLLLGYHDEEWGRRIDGDRAVFERVCLEAMQSGLSWLIVLRKRDRMRAAYAGFDPAVLATWGEPEVERLLADAGVIRNRAKIQAVIGNARVAVELPGGLAGWITQRAPAPRPRPSGLAEITPTSPESTAMARELRAAGMRFVGPTTLHALLQAGGWVDDHLDDCATAP